MNKIWRNTLLPLVFVGSLVALRFATAERAVQPGVIRVQRPLMGTVWNLEVADHAQPAAARRAIEMAYSELERIDALMSEWKPESPISQVDSAAGKYAVAVPPELRELIQRSIRYSEITGGTFDITWRGMGNIWHFDDAFAPPSEAAVAKARKNVNFRAIQVTGNRVFLPAGMNIGLGGIAKGYAVDRASAVLAAAGFRDSLVDGGGDVRVSGTRNGVPWQLGIQDPRQPRGKILGVVHLSNRVLVTSGDYERFRMVNGVRYHHIIDPRTGWPSTASISVSVIAKSAEEGVVLAKAIFMLGPDKGLSLARSHGVDALVIDPNEIRYATDGFSRLFETN